MDYLTSWTATHKTSQADHQTSLSDDGFMKVSADGVLNISDYNLPNFMDAAASDILGGRYGLLLGRRMWTPWAADVDSLSGGLMFWYITGFGVLKTRIITMKYVCNSNFAQLNISVGNSATLIQPFNTPKYFNCDFSV